MVDDRRIICGPGDKLRWLEHVSFHPKANDIHARIAVAITNRVDKFTGMAIVGQEWVAGKVGRTSRCVRKAIKEMADLQLLQITPSRGRGLANAYRLILPPIHLDEKRNGGSGFQPEKRNGQVQKEERLGPKTGTAVPPLPNTYQNSSGWQRSRDAFRQAKAELDAFVEACETNDHEASGTLQWQPIKQRLAARLGYDVTASWFGEVTLVRIEGAEIVLEAPSAFIRDSIINRYLVDIIAACIACDPDCGVTRARVVHRAVLRAAE